MKPRARILAVLAVLLLAFGVWAGRDRCTDAVRAPAVTLATSSTAPLRGGVGSAPFPVKLPTALAGFGAMRPKATTVAAPLVSRALVLASGEVRLALVELEVLYTTERLRAAIAEGFPGVVLVTASHTHAAPSGYDERLLARMLVAGSYAQAVEEALVASARQALAEAQRSLVPVTVEVSRGTAPALNRPRTGTTVDSRLTLVRLVADKPLGELIIYSAHPTLVGATARSVDPDWPGRLGSMREARSGAVALVLQGAGGNASTQGMSEPEGYARALDSALGALHAKTLATPSLAVAQVRLDLGRAELHRRALPPLRRVAQNVLCTSLPRETTLTAVDLNGLRLLFTGFEVSAEEGVKLEQAAGVERLLGLSGDYLGYLEPLPVAQAQGGESAQQYYESEAAVRVEAAAVLVGSALRSATHPR